MKRKDGNSPIDAANDTKTPPSEASPIARIEALEQRLTMLERVPLIARELQMRESWERKRDVERAQDRREAEARDQAAPKRTERFQAFVGERLERGPGRRTSCGHAFLAYREYMDEANAPRPERLYQAEFQTAILELDGVDSGLVTTELGNHVNGLYGVAVAEEYRKDTDSIQDQSAMMRAHQEAQAPASNKGPDSPDGPALVPDAPPADVAADVPVLAST